MLKVKLFKERCKELFSWIFGICVVVMSVVLVLCLIDKLPQSLLILMVGIMFVVVGLCCVGGIFYGIYWLFVDPFRKK